MRRLISDPGDIGGGRRNAIEVIGLPWDAVKGVQGTRGARHSPRSRRLDIRLGRAVTRRNGYRDGSPKPPPPKQARNISLGEE